MTRAQSRNFFTSSSRRMIASFLVLAIAVGGAACTRDRLDDFTAVELNKPESVHPIGYRQRRTELIVEMPRAARGLTADQHADVYRFIEDYKSQSNGRLMVSSPGGAGGHLSAKQTVRQVISLTRNAGIPDDAIQVSRHHHVKGEIGPAISISYAKPVAIAPHCGTWPKDIGNTNRERLPFHNFGCATQRNLAVNVANARDLQFPQDETPRSSERRSKHWNEYIGGKPDSGGSGGKSGNSDKSPAGKGD